MVRILTDFVTVRAAPDLPGRSGAVFCSASTLLGMLKSTRQAQVVVVNGAMAKIVALVALFLAFPFLRRPLVAVDLVLRPPRTVRQRLLLPFKRGVLRRVDHFVHYFRDLSGYERHFGITTERSSYVPFKVNIWGTLGEGSPQHGYVFAAGTSQRDYGTFIEAVRGCGYPAIIPEYSLRNLTGLWLA
jgi:hypothetical protein